MKILYVSDLDGTLLRSKQLTSDYTNQTINQLVDAGMCFSYATARSYYTSQKVTKGLSAKMPLIVYNGAFIIDNATGKRMLSNYLDSAQALLEDLLQHDVYPIVYSYIHGVEKFSFLPDQCSTGMQQFVASRTNDARANPMDDISQLCAGKVFYFTCIDAEDKLKPLYEKYKNKYHCVFSKDIYSGEQWLEIMPLQATKAYAVQKLKKHLDCDKLVVFGDGKNDLDMFEAADECYAVENAVRELKEIATAVIPSNDADGVAKWLAENYRQ